MTEKLLRYRKAHSFQTLKVHMHTVRNVRCAALHFTAITQLRSNYTVLYVYIHIYTYMFLWGPDNSVPDNLVPDNSVPDNSVLGQFGPGQFGTRTIRY